MRPILIFACGNPKLHKQNPTKSLLHSIINNLSLDSIQPIPTITFNDDNTRSKILTSLVRNNEEYKHTQVIWAFIRYTKDLRKNFGEDIYNQMIMFLKNKIKRETFFDKVELTLIRLNNVDVDNDDIEITPTKLFYKFDKIVDQDDKISYANLIKNDQKYKQYYTLYGNSLFLHDFISFINFYGEETYFTRGAFLITVINSQTLKNNIDKDIFLQGTKSTLEPIQIEKNISKYNKYIQQINKTLDLHEEDYISSILENAGFFFSHNNKTKYLERVKSGLDALHSINNERYDHIIKSIYFNQLRDIIKKDHKYCNWIDDDNFELLKCGKFEMYQSIFKLIYYLMESYLNTFDKDFYFKFPFIDVFIQIDDINIDHRKSSFYTPASPTSPTSPTSPSRVKSIFMPSLVPALQTPPRTRPRSKTAVRK